MYFVILHSYEKASNPDVLEMDGIQHVQIDETLCYDCLKEVPPNLYKNKESKGKGKHRKHRKRILTGCFVTPANDGIIVCVKK